MSIFHGLVQHKGALFYYVKKTTGCAGSSKKVIPMSEIKARNY